MIPRRFNTGLRAGQEEGKSTYSRKWHINVTDSHSISSTDSKMTVHSSHPSSGYLLHIHPSPLTPSSPS